MEEGYQDYRSVPRTPRKVLRLSFLDKGGDFLTSEEFHRFVFIRTFPNSIAMVSERPLAFYGPSSDTYLFCSDFLDEINYFHFPYIYLMGIILYRFLRISFLG